MKNDIKILAIESSCDETAAAVIGGCHPEQSEGSVQADSSSSTQNDGPIILSNIVSSQVDLHAKTGGVVPEVASRAHMEAIIPVIAEALLAAKFARPQKWTTNPSALLRVGATNHEKAAVNNLTIEQFNNESISFLQKEIDYIAVTAGPGLIGSLLVGFNAAKSLAYALDKPIIPVNHIEGHIYSAFSCHSEQSEESTEKTILDPRVKPEDDTSCRFPILSLTVSGGHTSLTLIKDHGEYENIGQTLDDAAGEAFDKVAKLLDLGYPGGPAVSKLAQEYRNQKWTTNKTNHEQRNDFSGSCCSLSILDRKAVVFPRPIMNDGTFNFSFSGLKTAVLQHVLNIKKETYFSCHPEQQSCHPEATPKDLEILRKAQNDIELSLLQKQEICAAFEDAVVDVLVTKTLRAVKKYEPKAVILAGGVAANELLRKSLEYRIQIADNSIKFLPAPKNLCGDNAAMIGLAAYYHVQKGNISSWDKVKVDSNLEL